MKRAAALVVFGAAALAVGAAQAADPVTAGNTNIGTHPSYGSSYSGFWRTNADYSVLTDSWNTFINAPAYQGTIYFRANNSDIAYLNTSGFVMSVPQTSNASVDINSTLTVNGYANVNGPVLARIASGGTAVTGITSNGVGVLGSGTYAYGVQGSSNWTAGVYGSTTNTAGSGAAGVLGFSELTSGVKGVSTNFQGVEGRSTNGYGGFFSGGNGVYAYSSNGLGVVAQGVTGVQATGSTYAVDAQGPMRVTGQVSFANNLTVSGHAYKTGGGAWEPTSDKRVKKDVVDFKQGLAQLEKIRPVSFKYNGLGETPDNGVEYVGVIAQELEKTAPFMVSSQKKLLHSDDKVQTDIKHIDPSAFTYMLINAVQQLSNQNREMKKVICQDHPSASLCTSTQ